MPIDLADYTPKIRAALKRTGFACVYVASAGAGKPCRIGYATDLPEAVKRLRRASPVPISLEHVMWVPDRAIATNIANAVTAAMGSARLPGGWNDVAVEDARGEVDITTFRLYPGATTVPHDQLIGQWNGRK